MKYIVDIKGEIEGDYEIIGKYEERPKGKWAYVDYGNGCGNWHCSNCRCMPWYSNDIHTLKYCPECGYDMREDKE